MFSDSASSGNGGPGSALFTTFPKCRRRWRFSAATLAGIFLGNIISWAGPSGWSEDNPGRQIAKSRDHCRSSFRRSAAPRASLALILPRSALNGRREAGQGLFPFGGPVGIGAEGSKGVVEFREAESGDTIGFAELNYAKEKQTARRSGAKSPLGSFVAAGARPAPPQRLRPFPAKR